MFSNEENIHIFPFFGRILSSLVVLVLQEAATARQVNCSSNSQTYLAKPSLKDPEIFKSLNLPLPMAITPPYYNN